MVKLPTDTKLNIRQRSVELSRDGREAVVSFEMFSHPADNGGQDCTVVILSKTVPHFSKNCGPGLNPDYDRIVTQAASELAKDFARMAEVLDTVAPSST